MHFLIDLYNWVYDLITNRITAARAGYLDRLDAAISTRAAASTAVANTDYTAARAGKLDNVDVVLSTRASESTPILKAPIAGGYVDQSKTMTAAVSLAGVASDQTSSTTYGDVVNYTGQGVLLFAAIQTAVVGQSASLKVVVDGVTYCDITTSTTQYALRCPVGGVTEYMVAFEAIPFKTSLQIQTKCSGGSNTARLLYKFRKTG